jgi:hypothetical protein
VVTARVAVLVAFVAVLVACDGEAELEADGEFVLEDADGELA